MAAFSLRTYASHLSKLRLCQLMTGRRCLSTTHVTPSQATTSDEAMHHSGEATSSDDSEEEYFTEDEIKHKILKSALDYVPQYGWSKEALAAGAETHGYPSVAHGMFPGGAADLISYFYLSCNERLVEQMTAQKLATEEAGEKLKISRFIRDNVEDRLRMNIPFMDSWAQAMAIMALPQNARQGWSNLASMVDDIWHVTGDTSTDMNWYTKRLSLGVVYKSSEVFMVQDRSEDYRETWAFLDRRLADVAIIGKAAGEIKDPSVITNLSGAFQVAKNMAGLADRRR